MHAAQIRRRIADRLEAVQDDRLLRAIESMLAVYLEGPSSPVVVGYDIDGTPLYAEEARAMFEEDLEALAQGGQRFTTEDLRKEAPSWIQGTK